MNEDIEDSFAMHQHINDLVLCPNNESVVNSKQKFNGLDDVMDDDWRQGFVAYFWRKWQQKHENCLFSWFEKKLLRTIFVAWSVQNIGAKASLLSNNNLQACYNITCEYGHMYDITLKKVMTTKRNSSENFKVNYHYIIAMHLLGKGLQTMLTFLGLPGICGLYGNYKNWKNTNIKECYH